MIEVQAAGICGSDIPRIFTTGTYHFPTIPGHEFSGKVVEVFDESGVSWLGKRVGIFPLIPCKECAPCQKEAYEMCTNYNYLGSRCDGGFAEYSLIFGVAFVSDFLSVVRNTAFDKRVYCIVI